MSGETGDAQSGWTVDTLRAHLEQRIDDLNAKLDERYATQTRAVERALEAQQTAMKTALTAAETAVSKALESAEKAVSKAESAAERRFELLNEFRGQLADQATGMMPRAESMSRHEAAAEKIADLAAKIDKAEGRGTGFSTSWGIVVAVFGLVVSALVIWSMLRGG